MTIVNNEREAISRTLKEYQDRIDALRVSIPLMEREKQTYIDARDLLKENLAKATKIN